MDENLGIISWDGGIWCENAILNRFKHTKIDGNFYSTSCQNKQSAKNTRVQLKVESHLNENPKTSLTSRLSSQLAVQIKVKASLSEQPIELMAPTARLLLPFALVGPACVGVRTLCEKKQLALEYCESESTELVRQINLRFRLRTERTITRYLFLQTSTVFGTSFLELRAGSAREHQVYTNKKTITTGSLIPLHIPSTYIAKLVF